jgi:diketogulonate reductase-like aldo/keto reductase
MKDFEKTFTVLNGVPIPPVGFGTWKIQPGKAAIAAVKEAFKAGYTHIDTATAYQNEESVGTAIREAEVNRKKLFITSKLQNRDHGYETALKAFQKTLDLLRVDYLDMYLIHWPIPGPRKDDWKEVLPQCWRALEEEYEKGRIKVIGVCNSLPHHVELILKTCKIKPMVNQLELHPGFMQHEAVKFSKDNGILVEAWSPLSNGKVFSSAGLADIAKRTGHSIAQICGRWLLQHEILPLPKSTNPERMRENLDVFGFELSDEDMAAIDALTDVGNSGWNPDNIAW